MKNQIATLSPESIHTESALMFRSANNTFQRTVDEAHWEKYDWCSPGDRSKKASGREKKIGSSSSLQCTFSPSSRPSSSQPELELNSSWSRIKLQPNSELASSDEFAKFEELWARRNSRVCAVELGRTPGSDRTREFVRIREIWRVVAELAYFERAWRVIRGSRQDRN